MIFVHYLKGETKNQRTKEYSKGQTRTFCSRYTIAQEARCCWANIRVFNCSIGGIQTEQMRQGARILYLQMCMWQGSCTNLRLINQIRKTIMRMQENGNDTAEMQKRFNRAKVWQINSIRNDLESQQNHPLPLSVRLR